MNRRKAVTLLGGAAAGWPLAASAQQSGGMRRIGVLMASAADEPVSQARIAAFLQGLSQLGWTEDRNVRIDTRWATTNADDLRRQAAELVALTPDVLVAATGTATAAPLLQATRTLPIVFVIVIDPVGAGFVTSLVRPGGNATGFLMFEYGLSTKWLELLKQIAPGVARAAVVRDPAIASGIGQFAAIQAVAPALGVDLTPVDARDAPEIERAITAFSRSGDAGLIVTASAVALRHRDLIVTLAARHRLPAVYTSGPYVAAGGLISYGPDLLDQYRRAASYVDRILKGEKPANLPVQAPTKYELIINLKTAKALGLDVPMAVLARADEVITLLRGAAVAWPVAARAQQPALPVIGFLKLVSPDTYADRLPAFRQGLRDTGYVEGQNIAVEYRWAENQIDRLSTLAAELVRRPVAVIVAAGGPAATIAARAETATIPIVFSTAEDPVRHGLVSSLARPSGNLTGINIFIGELAAKRLELLRELVPKAVRLAVLFNPTDAASAGTTLRDLEAAQGAASPNSRCQHRPGDRRSVRKFAQERPHALFVTSQPLFSSRRVQLALLAAHHSIPAIYGVREIAEVGGLMSYGINLADAWRHIGVYTGRILKGAKPTDLPVAQSSKYELVINQQAARILGLTVPPQLLARADKVIE